MRSVCHPIHGGGKKREQAMTLIGRVSPELQEQLDAERKRRGLPREDKLPLLKQDYLNISVSVMRVLTLTVLL